MNDLIDQGKREKQIWTKKKYIVFTDIMSRPEMEKTVHLRLANLKEDNKDKKKEKPS